RARWRGDYENQPSTGEHASRDESDGRDGAERVIAADVAGRVAIARVRALVRQRRVLPDGERARDCARREPDSTSNDSNPAYGRQPAALALGRGRRLTGRAAPCKWSRRH